MEIVETTAPAAVGSVDYWSRRLEEAQLKSERQQSAVLRQMYLQLANHYRFMLNLCQTSMPATPLDEPSSAQPCNR